MTRVCVAGTGLRGSGYPNATGTIQVLREELGWDVDDRAAWLPEGTTLWRMARGGRARAALFLFKLLALNGWEFLRVLASRAARSGWIYVPYPSVFLLWWMSWIPRRWRPRVIADAYVSLWDAAFRDRAATGGHGLVSKSIKRFEARALRAADWVLVDTLANRDAFVRDFGIQPRRIRALPLAIGDSGRRVAATGGDKATPSVGTVLFVGTLVPLHGIGVVADAARLLLAQNLPVRFEFVGDGQDQSALLKLSEEFPPGQFEWERGWQSAESVRSRMLAATVCLGVFGGEGKAARVLPFKVYLALASGRPLVTQKEHSRPEGAPPIPALLVEPSAEDLSAALKHLLANPTAREELALASRRYFDDYLGPRALAMAWTSLIRAGRQSP